MKWCTRWLNMQPNVWAKGCWQVGLVGASIALQSQGLSPMASQAGMTALGLGTQVGILLPFSRKHESEADYIGLLLAAQAGYPPGEAVHVWERMEAESGEQTCGVSFDTSGARNPNQRFEQGDAGSAPPV